MKASARRTSGTFRGEHQCDDRGVIVSIHQPQYIPWPGYFYKILHSDVFVLYDTVQYPRGKHFANRNQVKTANGVAWLTVPVLRRGGLLPYLNTQVEQPAKWASRHWRTLEVSYAKSPYFSQTASALSAAYGRSEWPNVAELDLEFIKVCLEALACDVRIIRASELNASATDARGGDYILAILKEVGATKYITGQGEGSLRYVNPLDFADAEIELKTFVYDSPHYPQLWGEFIPDLSIIDMLANVGPATRTVIESSGCLSKWDGG